MNLYYWEEQIKATIAVAAHLAVPVTSNENEQVYLPTMFWLHQEHENLDEPCKMSSGNCRCRMLSE